MVLEQRYHCDRRTSPRRPEHDSRCRVVGHEGLVGLDAKPSYTPPDSGKMGTTGSGHVCISADNSAAEIFQLETRPRGRGLGCIQSGLERTLNLQCLTTVINSPTLRFSVYDIPYYNFYCSTN